MIALCEYTQFYPKGQKIGFCILDTKAEWVIFLATKINYILNEHSFIVISTTLHIKLVVADATQALMVVSVVKPLCQVEIRYWLFHATNLAYTTLPYFLFLMSMGQNV